MPDTWWATAHCPGDEGGPRTIQSGNADAIRATAAYWRTRNWVDRVETNTEEDGRDA
jgi:hypothetical protein